MLSFVSMSYIGGCPTSHVLLVCGLETPAMGHLPPVGSVQHGLLSWPIIVVAIMAGRRLQLMWLACKWRCLALQGHSPHVYIRNHGIRVAFCELVQSLPLKDNDDEGFCCLEAALMCAAELICAVSLSDILCICIQDAWALTSEGSQSSYK